MGRSFLRQFPAVCQQQGVPSCGEMGTVNESAALCYIFLQEIANSIHSMLYLSVRLCKCPCLVVMESSGNSTTPSYSVTFQFLNQVPWLFFPICMQLALLFLFNIEFVYVGLINM